MRCPQPRGDPTTQDSASPSPFHFLSRNSPFTGHALLMMVNTHTGITNRGHTWAPSLIHIHMYIHIHVHVHGTGGVGYMIVTVHSALPVGSPVCAPSLQETCGNGKVFT